MEFLTIALIWSLPLISGMADAASRSVIKIANKLHNFTLLSLGFLFALPFYLVGLFFTGIPAAIGNNFWIAIALHVPLFAIVMILTVEAHRASPLAAIMPYLSVTPALLLGTTPAMALLFPELQKSNPTIIGTFGIFIVVLGLWILNMRMNQQHFFDPLRVFWDDRGSRLMFFAAVISSVIANLDLVALKNANIPFYFLVEHGLLVIMMAFLILLYSTMKWGGTLPFSPRGFWKYLILFGGFTALIAIPHVAALQWIPVVSYVIAGKRAGAIIFALLLGLIMGVLIKHPLFQNERKNIRYRLPGTLIAVLGMIIIIVWGKV